MDVSRALVASVTSINDWITELLSAIRLFKSSSFLAFSPRRSFKLLDSFSKRLKASVLKPKNPDLLGVDTIAVDTSALRASSSDLFLSSIFLAASAILYLFIKSSTEEPLANLPAYCCEVSFSIVFGIKLKPVITPCSCPPNP